MGALSKAMFTITIKSSMVTSPLFVQSPTPLPSGTVVQAKVTEEFELASGQTASEEVRRQDILLYRAPLPADAPEAIAGETVRIVRSFLETGKVPNVVNLASRTPAICRLVVRHRDRPGVLAHVFDQLRAASINVQETENVIFEGAEAAVARINLDGRPSDEVLARITSGNEDVLSAQVVTL